MVTPKADRIQGIRRSYYNVPKAIFYNLRGTVVGFIAQSTFLFSKLTGDPPPD